MVNMKKNSLILKVSTLLLCVLIPFLHSCQGKRENMIKESDRLFADGVRLYNEGKYKEAIYAFKKCQGIDTLIYEYRNDSRRYYANMWHASCLFKLGKIEEAAEIDDTYMVEPIDRRLTVESDSLINIVYYLMEDGEMERALPLIEEVIELEIDELGNDNLFVANSYGLYAYFLESIGRFDESLNYYQKSLALLEKHCGKSSKLYAYTLSDLLRTWLSMGNYEDIPAMANQLIEIGEILDGDKSIFVYRAHYILGDNYLYQGDYEKASLHYKEAIRIIENSDMKLTEGYGLILMQLGKVLFYDAQYDVALKILENSYLYMNENFENYHPLYMAECLCYLSKTQYEVGNVEECVKLSKDGIDIFDKYEVDKNYYVYVELHRNLCNCYISMQNEELAFSYAENIVNYYKNNTLDFNISYVDLLNDYSSNLLNTDKIQYAIDLTDEALDIVKKILPNSHSHYYALSIKAQSMIIIGNYIEAVEYQKEAVHIAELLYTKNSSTYSDANTLLLTYSHSVSDSIELSNMIRKNTDYVFDYTLVEPVISAYVLGDLDKTELLLIDMLNDMENHALNNTDYSYALLFLAIVQCKEGKYTEALINLEKIYDEPYFSLSSNITFWEMLFSVNYALMRYDEAKDAIVKAIIISEQKGIYNLNSLLQKVWLSMIEYDLGDISESLSIVNSAYEDIVRQIFVMFSTMSNSERMKFWSQISFVFESIMPYMAYHTNDPKLIENTYDALLLSKGILLNTEREVGKILMESNDQTAVDAYRELLSIRQQYNDVKSHDAADGVMRADSLYELIRYKERELMSISAEYGDYTNNLRIGWHDVQEKLRRKDVAIEFVNVFDDTAVSCMAFVLTSTMKRPELVKLFEYPEMEQISPDDYYKDDTLYRLIWEPLDSYMKYADRIFFSPSGILHNLAIESLPMSDGKLVSDIYSLYRLSSTRELALISNTKKEYVNKSVLLYGGIDYDADKETIDNANKVNDIYKNENTYNDDKFSLIASNNTHRGAIQGPLRYLDGTLTEVKAIADLLYDNDWKYKEFLDAEASETSFKNISGTGYDVIHLATHGYYIPSMDSYKVHYALDKIISSSMNIEDWALSRSGLYMSGANNTLNDIHNENFADDGILTAADVASLDLRNVSLVTLSACETALGDVTGDGILGLQRGFKKAGVKSILMSLWKVNDAATSVLMTEFYNNWIEGKSKYEALRLAQQTVRSHKEKSWDDPKYWAAFILLDAFEK